MRGDIKHIWMEIWKLFKNIFLGRPYLRKTLFAWIILRQSRHTFEEALERVRASKSIWSHQKHLITTRKKLSTALCEAFDWDGGFIGKNPFMAFVEIEVEQCEWVWVSFCCQKPGITWALNMHCWRERISDSIKFHHSRWASRKGE